MDYTIEPADRQPVSDRNGQVFQGHGCQPIGSGCNLSLEDSFVQVAALPEREFWRAIILHSDHIEHSCSFLFHHGLDYTMDWIDRQPILDHSGGVFSGACRILRFWYNRAIRKQDWDGRGGCLRETRRKPRLDHYNIT